MRVGGNEYDRIGVIRISVESVHTYMRLVTRPFDYPYPVDTAWKDNEGILHFEDTRELDILIDALQKFRDENRKYIGEWSMINIVREGD